MSTPHTVLGSAQPASIDYNVCPLVIFGKSWRQIIGQTTIVETAVTVITNVENRLD